MFVIVIAVQRFSNGYETACDPSIKGLLGDVFPTQNAYHVLVLFREVWIVMQRDHVISKPYEEFAL